METNTQPPPPTTPRLAPPPQESYGVPYHPAPAYAYYPTPPKTSATRVALGVFGGIFGFFILLPLAILVILMLLALVL